MNDRLSRPFSADSFNQFLAEHKLMGSRCTNCKTLYLPPRAICPRCHKDNLEWVEMSGKGTLAAYTSIYIAPTFMLDQGFDRQAPYLTGIVALEEGVKISARITGLPADDPSGIEIDAPIQAVFLELEAGQEVKTQLAFKPAE
jgi:uncharacterized OB-fold protein